MAEETDQVDVTDVTDLPSALIIANVDASVFDDAENKEKFERVFSDYDEAVTFQYIKCFRRVRVNFSSSEIAARARISLNETSICGQKVKCYFAQVKGAPQPDSSHYLRPPPVEKQFLISPPASPPVGWEQVHEAEPVINYDIIAAIAQLAPGQAHELHPQSESQPGIVVHICEDQENSRSTDKPPIMQTRCPERRT